MKLKPISMLTFTFMLALCSWNNPQNPDIDKASWLAGTWQNKSEKMFETWKKVSDTEFAGKSYMLRKNDTLVFETIRLIQKLEGLAYIPKVRNQNKNQPVEFLQKKVTETELVFENPKHDFPQVIAYKLINPDSLVAEISASKNGKVRKQTFAMKRLK
ncbi:DUF6265 family protein [Adhaeribacter terreus]|uniref:DUF6265 family protein n=1 Tax=Adhaeribacter terreus TaxID=529703 RepID=A0ABW0E827_9BACT